MTTRSLPPLRSSKKRTYLSPWWRRQRDQYRRISESSPLGQGCCPRSLPGRPNEQDPTIDAGQLCTAWNTPDAPLWRWDTQTNGKLEPLHGQYVTTALRRRYMAHCVACCAGGASDPSPPLTTDSSNPSSPRKSPRWTQKAPALRTQQRPRADHIQCRRSPPTGRLGHPPW